LTQIEVGAILDGTVSSIAKFGAFVNLPERRSGLVHISEIASEYVADVNDFLQVGQAVKVKVLAITPEGKINLSIKRAQPEPEKPAAPRRAPKPQPQRSAEARSAGTATPQGVVYGSTGDASFEDQLKRFMQESDSRIAGNRLYSDRSRGRRRKG
jgi:S1 RNA binding domain protein